MICFGGNLSVNGWCSVSFLLLLVLHLIYVSKDLVNKYIWTPLYLPIYGFLIWSCLMDEPVRCCNVCVWTLDHLSLTLATFLPTSYHHTTDCQLKAYLSSIFTHNALIASQHNKCLSNQTLFLWNYDLTILHSSSMCKSCAAIHQLLFSANLAEKDRGSLGGVTSTWWNLTRDE